MMALILISLVCSFFLSVIISHCSNIHKLERRAAIIKTVIIAIIFAPSVFISTHAAIPGPAILVVFYGLKYPSPIAPEFLHIIIYLLAVSLNIAVMYSYSRFKYNRLNKSA